MNNLSFIVYDNILSGLTGDLNCDYCFDGLSKSYILVCRQLDLTLSETTFEELQESVKTALNSLLYVLSFGGDIDLDEFAAKHKIEVRNFPNYTNLTGKYKLPFIIYNKMESVDELEIEFYGK